MKNKALSRAFDLMITPVESNSPRSDSITFEQFSDVYQTLLHRSNNENKQKQKESLIAVLWSLLKTSENSDKVSREAFLHLNELFNLRFMVNTKKKNITFFELYFPSVYNSALSKSFKSFVRSTIFRILFDVLILLNAIIIALELDQKFNYIEWMLLAVFMIEILAKIYTFGLFRFLKKFWNVFDLIVIGSAVIIWLVIAFDRAAHAHIGQYLDLILILRVLRLCKIISNIKRFKIIVKTVRALIPSFITYGGLLVVVYYVYAIIGLKLFAGKVMDNYASGCKNDTIHCCRINNVQLSYCTLNFNNFLTSTLVLFDLMVVNQWHVIAQSFEFVTGKHFAWLMKRKLKQTLFTGTKWTRLYFVSFHLTCVLVVLNIFTAFVLEAFILEYTNVNEGYNKRSTVLQRLEQMGLDCAAKRKASISNSVPDEDLIDADHDVIDDGGNSHFYTNTDASIVLNDASDIQIIVKEKKSVEVLLMRMFENEIELPHNHTQQN